MPQCNRCTPVGCGSQLCGRHTALMEASHSGHLRVVELLIAAGADVRGDDGCDPHVRRCAPVRSTAVITNGAAARRHSCWAARGGHADIIATLAAAGADRCG
jgi:hypothetical protein